MITNRSYIQDQFCNYEIAVKLKELGFNMQCFAYYYTLDGNNYEFALEEEFHLIDDDLDIGKNFSFGIPLWQQAIDWCDSNGLLVGTIAVDNLYKSTINKINHETELFHSRNESIKRAIEFAISYLQDNK